MKLQFYVFKKASDLKFRSHSHNKFVALCRIALIFKPLICKTNIYIGQALTEEAREELLRKMLWIESNYQEYKTKEEDGMKAKLANNSKHKMYRYVRLFNMCILTEK